MKRFFNIFLSVFAIFVIFSSQAQAKVTEFVQVTDLHFAQDEKAVQNFENLINFINTKLNDADFVVFTGDNIDKAQKNTLVDFLKMCKKLNKPYYIEIGNHDCFKSHKLDKVTYAKLVGQYSHQKNKSFNFVVKKSDLVFIFIDGMKEFIPARNGYFKESQLTWLDTQLTKYKDKHVIIFQHFPLINESEKNSHNLYNAQSYWDLLKKHDNVKAIFAGHYHKVKEEKINGVLHIVSPPAKVDSSKIRYVVVDESKNDIEIYSSIIEF